MKKAIVLILALCMVLTMAACGAKEEKVIGLWQRETVYLPSYGCDADLFIAFAESGDYLEVVLDHDDGELLNMEMGEWDIVKGKVEAEENGEAGTTVYKYLLSGKLKNGDLKYTRIGDPDDFEDIMDLY